MVRTAEVIYVGDAASLIKASKEAADAAAKAEAAISGVNGKMADSYGKVVLAAKEAGDEAAKVAASIGGTLSEQAAAYDEAATRIAGDNARISESAVKAGEAAARAAATMGATLEQQRAAFVEAANEAGRMGAAEEEAAAKTVQAADEMAAANERFAAAARTAGAVAARSAAEAGASMEEQARVAGEAAAQQARAVGASADEQAAAYAKAADAARASAIKQEEASARSGASLKGFADSAKSVGSTLSKYVTVPVLIAAVAGVHFASSFQQEMLKVHTQAGATSSEVRTMSAEILKLAPATQQGPVKLAEAVYQLESVGIRGARAIATLRAASEGAAMGNADLEQTTSALAAATAAYDLPASEMQSTMGTLDATVGVGKMRMEELVESFKTGILPVAQMAHVSLPSLGADLAVLTDRGVPATRGMTYLRQAIFYLANESTKPAVEALSKLGLTSKQVGKELEAPDGLARVVETLHRKLAGFGKGEQLEILKDLGGGARSATGLVAVYNSIGNSLSDVRGKYTKIREVAGSFHHRVIEQAQTMSAKMKQAWSGIQTALITFGNTLGPIVAAVAGGIAKIAHAFASLPSGVRNSIMVFAILAAAIGPVIVIAGAVAGAIGAISLPVAAVVAGVILAAGLIATNWKTIKDAVGSAVKAVSGYLNEHKAALKTVEVAVKAIATVLSAVWRGFILPLFKSVLAQISEELKAAFKVMEGIVLVFTGLLEMNFKVMWDGIKKIFSGALEWVISALKAATAPMRIAAEALWHVIGGPLEAAASWIAGLVSKLISGAISIIKGFFNEIYNAGKFLIEGFVHGIESGASAVKKVAEGIAKLPGNIVKEVLGIKSPSKVFVKFGEGVAEGFVTGLLTHKEMVESGLNQSLIFPVDAAIEALKGKITSMEEESSRMAKSMERKKLVEAIQTAARRPHEIGSVAAGSGMSPASIISWAQQHVGDFAESAGPNRGPALDKLEQQFGMVGQAWCAMFATTAAVMGGASKDIKSASVASLKEWASQGTHGFVKGVQHTPKPGDLMAFGNNHVAFVEKVAGDVVHTIEGNANGQGGVARFTHRLGEGEYLRPRYHALGHASVRASGPPVHGVSMGVQPPNIERIAHLEEELSKLHHERIGASGKGNAPERVRIANEELRVREEIKKLKESDKTAAQVEKGTTAYRKAVEALHNFDAKAAEAQKLSRIKIQVEHLEQLKQWEEAIEALKAKMNELAASAASAWNAMRGKQISDKHDKAIEAIEKGPEAAGIKKDNEEEEKEQTEKTEKANKKALDEAKQKLKEARGNENPKEIKENEEAVKDAEDNITAFNRQQDRKRREQKVEEEKKGADETQKSEESRLEEETKKYEETLANQLAALTKSLQQGELDYKKYVESVNKILAGTGVALVPTASEQGTLSAGPGPAATGSSSGSAGSSGGPLQVVEQSPQPGSRAMGGTVIKGVPYWVGETGRELFTPHVSGQITPASVASAAGVGGGGPLVNIENAHMHSRREAESFAHRLAHKLVYGGRV